MNILSLRQPSTAPPRLIFFLMLCLLIDLASGCGDAQPTAGESSDAGQAISVQVVPAERRTIAETLHGLGTCEALLEKTATIAPAMEGQVRKILIQHGDPVKAGQPLVQLDTKLAEANLREKISLRDGLKESLRLLKSQPQETEQQGYQLAIEDAKLAVQKAKAILDKLRPLKENHEISDQQMLEAELALQQANLAQQKAENQLQVILLNPRKEAIDEATAHIETADADVAIARLQRDLLTLRSPIDGVVDHITCKLGQTLAVGAPISEVVDLRQLNVLIWLPAIDAVKVHPGQKTVVYSDESSQQTKMGEASHGLQGLVTSVGEVVDSQTGSLPIRVLIDNAPRSFALGQTVTAAITIEEKADTLAVPKKALDDLGSGPQLSLVQDGKTVLLHPRLGIRDKNWVEIDDESLKPGDLVIVEGGFNLPEGTKVTPKPDSNSEASTAPAKDTGETAKP